MQTLIFKNCVMLSKMNWKREDFSGLKRFMIQDSVINFTGLLYKPFGDTIEEYTALDVEPRENYGFDPMDAFSRYPMARRFAFIKIVRVRGKVMPVTVWEFLNLIREGRYPFLEFAMM